MNKEKEIKTLMIYLAIGQIFLEFLDQLSETHIWKQTTKKLGNMFIKHLEKQINVLFKGGSFVVNASNGIKNQSKIVYVEALIGEDGQLQFLDLQRYFEDAIRDAANGIELKEI